MSNAAPKKKLTRGEKILLVAPLFVLLLLSLNAFYKNLQPLLFEHNFPNDIQNPQGDVLSLHSSPDGQQIIARSVRYNRSFMQAVLKQDSVSETWFLTSWKVKSKKILWSIPVTESVKRPVFSPDNQRFLLLTQDYTSLTAARLELRVASTGQTVWSIIPLDSCHSVSFTADGKSIVSVGKSVEVLDAQTGLLKRRLRPKAWGTFSFFTTDGKNFLSVSPVARPKSVVKQAPFSEVQVFDLATGRKTHTFVTPEILKFNILMARTEVVITSLQNGTEYSGQTQVWNYRTGHALRTLSALPKTARYLQRNCISPKGDFIFLFNHKYPTGDTEIVSPKPKSELVDLRTGKIVWTIPAVVAPRFCQFSPDGHFISTSEYVQEGNDGYIRVILRDAKTGAELRSFATPDSRWTTGPTFTGDSRHMFFSFGDHIYIWKTNSRTTDP